MVLEMFSLRGRTLIRAYDDGRLDVYGWNHEAEMILITRLWLVIWKWSTEGEVKKDHEPRH